MKKLLLLASLFTIFLSACGSSVTMPVITATTAFTTTPEPTATTAFTATPEIPPTPDFTKPYAVIASDKAEFWFPFPSKDHGWSIVPVSKECFCGYWGEVINSWSVFFEATEQTYLADVSCGDPNNQLYEEIPDSDMLKRCNAKIKLVDSSGSTSPSEYQNITFSEYNNGMLITLTESSLVQALYEARPQQIRFDSYLFTQLDIPDIKDLKADHWRSDIAVIYN